MTEFTQFNNLKNELTLENMVELQTLISKSTLPYVFELLPSILELQNNGSSDIRNVSSTVLDVILTTMSPNSLGQLLPHLFSSMELSKNWRVRVKALTLLGRLPDLAPYQVSVYLPDIVPQLTPHMNDIKKEVKSVAYDTMVSCCNVIGNTDIEHMTQHIVKAIMNPSDVPELMHKLAGVIFVQSVKSAALAIVVPLLLRGLNAKVIATRRQSAIIIENMSKLVDDPLDATPFLPRLLPALRDSAENMSDPEARVVMERALKQLERLNMLSSTMKTNRLEVSGIENEIQTRLTESNSSLNPIVVTYVANQCACLTLTNDFTQNSWNDIACHLESLGDGGKLCEQLKQMCLTMIKQEVKIEEDDQDEVLCDCQFTLAYGTKILLHNTRMKLKRGHKYGLIGPISSGKSTFLKSMANGSLEGFPDPTVLKTVYVQADILGELSHLSCLDYVMQDEQIIGLTKEDVLSALNDMGFNETSPAKPSHPVHTFSGGYRIKMAMVQAMLKKPDILLLDEPVKHLDVLNIAWVKNYISSLKNVTCIMVSKNRGFLNECCTDIINIDHLKLHQHRGNLASFLSSHPEYEKYYKIEESEMKFSFPPVSQVEGVKSKGRALMKMTNCTFTYPGNTTPTIFNITAQVSMGSKTAVYGPNGHGKSTMIKVLTGEVVPEIGEVWSHENARIAYIAQHAFHHIEHHLDKTPKEYLQWRYSGMVDKEGIVKLAMVPTEEELRLQKEPFEYTWQDEPDENVKNPPVKRAMKVIIEVTGNRKQNRNKEYEYEVRFKDGTEGMVDKKLMIKRGFEKKTKEVDLKIAQLTGLSIKPLTGANIEKHFKDCCGLDPEVVSHQRISQLADGEKNLIVFGASCWNQPHIIIADEPTNFLSGRSLIGLANALKTFDGGVVVITHDEEFAKHVCTQTWSIFNGILSVSGEDADWISKQDANIKKIENTNMVTTITDRGGNTTEVKIKKKLSARDKKAKMNVVRKKIENGDELDSDEDEIARENNMY